MLKHTTVPGDAIYGAGSHIDTSLIPCPTDARRVFELLAASTPGFTQDHRRWDAVSFEGSPEPVIPGPIKAAVVASALHAMCGVVAGEIVDDRDGGDQPIGSAPHHQAKVNTDHTSLWLGCIFAPRLNGKDGSALGHTPGAIAQLFPPDSEYDFEREWMATPMNLRGTAIYPTATPGTWFQLHGSLDAPPLLRSLGIDPNFPAANPHEAYEHIASHLVHFKADELELAAVRGGFCGQICYTPAAWRKSEMGRTLARHPLVNWRHLKYVTPTPPSPLPPLRSDDEDRRPLRGVKVVELVRIIAGPVIGSTLAALGADVIRVGTYRLRDINLLQLSLNAGVRSIDLDLDEPSGEGRARLRELVAGADVFVQGFRPASIARRGFGLDDVLTIAAARGKGIVYVEENAYGPPDVTYHARPGWQQIGDAASGSSVVIGASLARLAAGDSTADFDPSSAPAVLPPLPVSDMTTGVIGVLGALLALRDRARKGGSYHVLGSLVAADEIALRPEIGLYSPTTVARTARKFGWDKPGCMNPELYVSEMLDVVWQGWKRVIPERLEAAGTPGSWMVGFSQYKPAGVDDGEQNDDTTKIRPFGSHSHWDDLQVLGPVVQLGDARVTPRWTTPPVPNCGRIGKGGATAWLE